MLGGSDLCLTQDSIGQLDDYPRESNVVAKEGLHEHKIHDKEAVHHIVDLSLINDTMSLGKNRGFLIRKAQANKEQHFQKNDDLEYDQQSGEQSDDIPIEEGLDDIFKREKAFRKELTQLL